MNVFMGSLTSTGS